MEDDVKRMFGKILGELYRTQRMLAKQSPTIDAHTYGLLHGFESSIDEELASIGWITGHEENAAGEVLDEYFSDQTKLDSLKGFYEVEDKLEARGINRSKALRIFKKMMASHQFESVLRKFDSTHSPGELRRFDINERD